MSRTSRSVHLSGYSLSMTALSGRPQSSHLSPARARLARRIPSESRRLLADFRTPFRPQASSRVALRTQFVPPLITMESLVHFGRICISPASISRLASRHPSFQHDNLTSSLGDEAVSPTADPRLPVSWVSGI